jgi:aspartyl/glutamyl-tRNA(Asn/Gln) amidotransferase C subunit
MISKEEVKHIAKLARLELGTSSSQASTEKEIEKMQEDLSSVLDYFNLLKKVKTKKLSTIDQSMVLNGNVVRKDEISEKISNLSNNLIQAAPDKKDDYIKVKTIL